MSILNITETGFNDDSIEEYEYFEYLPIVGAVNNLNNNGGDLTINIETQDIFTHSSESYLLIEGKLVRGPDAVLYEDEDVVTLTNNGLMYLFKNIRYDLSGKEIERIARPGWDSTMLGLLKYSEDFSKSRELNQFWYKDTSNAAVIDEDDENFNRGFSVRHAHIIKKPEPKGTFSFRVPLKHIFGFCEDYDKVLYGKKQTLYLTRSNNNDAIYKAAQAAGPPVRHEVGKVTLEKVAWYMPHVLPMDKYKMELYKHIQNKESFPVNYRMLQCDTSSVSQTQSFTWRLVVKTSPEFPRYIIIGFQTNKKNAQLQNPAIFDHVNVTDIHVTLNSFQYPRIE